MPFYLKYAFTYKITDDSGFSAIVNADKYPSFVKRDWHFNDLKVHFTEAMNNENLIIWGTGMEGDWAVKFVEQPSPQEAYREFDKVICVTTGGLYLTNYEDLTLAAQFEDRKIPAMHRADLFVPMTNGRYNLTIRQMFNPNSQREKLSGKINFEVVVQKAPEAAGIQKVESIFWCEQ